MTVTKRGISRLLVPGVAVLEDFSDRLNHVWTFGLLLLMAALIGWRQQGFNDPIVCAFHDHFTNQHVAYARAKCFANNHYYNIAIPHETNESSIRVTGWLYKWLPIILIIQALLFKLPNIVLTVLHGYSGISFEKIAGLTKGYSQLNLTERTLLGRQIGRYVYNWCSQSENCLPWRLLTLNWLLVKVMYVCNALVQIILVDKFLNVINPISDNSTASTSYGEVIYDNLFNKNATVWKSPAIFPRNIICSHSVRQLRNVQKYSHQCDLPINEFNEYVYMVLWIWLLLVTLFSCLSLTKWALFTLLPFPRERYVTRMIALSGEPNINAASITTNQLVSLIGEDGVSILKLIASNSSELLVKDIVTTIHQLKGLQQQTQFPHHPEVMQYPIASTHAPAQSSQMTSGPTVK